MNSLIEFLITLLFAAIIISLKAAKLIHPTIAFIGEWVAILMGVFFLVKLISS